MLTAHDCPTPAVFDPDSGAMPQSKLAFKIEGEKLIEICMDCGAATEASAEHAAAYYRGLEEFPDVARWMREA